MSIRRRISIGVAVAGVIAVAMVAGSRTLAQTKTVVWPADAIKWTDTTAAPGAKIAVLWGDPNKGAYGALKQVPGGTVLAKHTHKNDSHVLMVMGSISLEIEGKTTVLGPGSFATIPGGVPHAATCRGTAACQYFETMSGVFDSTPAK
jgi:quercetin dioxygenase-like cupin family protein